ncbi:MAG: transcriptional regulator [Pseudomonadota bacterium]
MGYIAHTRFKCQVISAAQIRAGRGLLGLSSQELAELSDVGWSTIKRYEDIDGIPPTRAGTLERVKKALEAEGVEFIGDPIKSPGVWLRR